MAALRKALYDAAGITFRWAIKGVNLEPISSIKVTFDPFNERSTSARDFLYVISIPKVKYTNINCLVSHKVMCDGSDPKVEVQLADNHMVLFKSANLTAIEMLNFMKSISEQRIVRTESS